MNQRQTIPRYFILVLLFILFLVLACSTPSWFPLKKGTSYKAKTKELIDKEVVIIDKVEYVKVLNPKASEGKDQPKYLYIPVNEYLSRKGEFLTPTLRQEEVKREASAASTKAPSPAEEEVLAIAPSKSAFPDLKRKVVIAHFDDRTTQGEEVLGDWVAEKLMKEANRRSHRILLTDYQMIKEFLDKKGTDLKDIETPKVLYLLNEVFGIQALVLGQLSGPYVFTTKPTKEEEGTASAIIRIEMRLVDAFSGKTLKNFSANNPIFSSKQRGTFSEEKAKVKAIDITIADLGRALARELDNMDWFCRIAKVEGDEVYLNAGKLTGLKVGDVMEVLRPGAPGERGETKGKVKISAFFGIDASMGRLIQGKNAAVNDILKLAKGEGT